MASIPVNSMKKGMAILFNGVPHLVLGTEHVKPSRASFVQTKMKNLKQGNIFIHRFNSSDKVDALYVERKKYNYSYDAGDAFVFMEGDTFEEYRIPRADFEDQILFLKDGDEVTFEFCGDQLVNIALPKTVIHTIKETPPGLKGATATNQLKPATTETGLQIKIPPFLDVGDVVKIDTDTGDYMERAK